MSEAKTFKNMNMLLMFLCTSSIVSKVASNCEEGKSCKLLSGQSGMCFAGECLTHIAEETRENLTFTIIVRYPEYNLYNPNNSGMFIRGNGLGLQWNTGKQLIKTNNDTWEITIAYKSSNNGFQCQNCTPQEFVYLQNNKLQYRLFIDDRKDMIGPNFAILFPVSQTSSYFDKKVEFVVYPRFIEYTGSVETFELVSKYIGKARKLTIYTPPSFGENPFKTYATLIVFDLSFDYATFFKQNFEQPILRSKSEEYILIGFGDYKDNGKEREHILSHVPGSFFDCINGTYADYCDGCIPVTSTDEEYMRYLIETCGKQIMFRGQGDATLDFLTMEALPMAERMLGNRIERDRLGVIGYSLGGLMSCYAAWTRPEVFSFAACQSPSFWWPNSNASLSEPLFHFINKTLKDHSFLVNRTDQKFYIDAGGAETDAPYNMAQAAVEVGQYISSLEHFKLDTNVWIDVDPHKTHNLKEWAKRMGQALTTLLPAHGEPSMPAPVTNQANVSKASIICLLLIYVLAI